MRKPPPRRQTRSIVSASATPSASMRSDSSVKGRARRLAMKPGLSLARIGVRPMRAPTSAAASSAAGEESAVATTSTSFISAGGLKKCMPTTRSGCGTSAAIAVTGSEEVLLARIAPGPQASARPANSSRFSPRSSGAASTTRSHSPRSPMLVAAPTRSLATFGSRFAPQALRRALGQAPVQPLDARLERRWDGVVETGLVAAQGSDLGDPGAHRAGADDADPLDAHDARFRFARAVVICLRTSARASRGRPACPRPGPRSPSPARRGGARARGRR